MTGPATASARFKAIREIANRTPRAIELPRDERGRLQKVSDYYGSNVFDLNKLREKLPKETFEKLRSTIESGHKLDLTVANAVAHAAKEWALAHGATHFCHWFQPQTGLTAEKHDAFVTFDSEQRMVEKFSGAQLIQSEPDASSFPSGGMRTTFEARGYTAWDPSSPMFLMETTNGKTLCIPSCFISYHGDALDQKTGLMRSVDALSERAAELLKLLGQTQVKRVIPTLGIEQEYFLIDRAFYMLRPDLIMSGRTLLGGQPPKGQQLEDHYFGSIPARVQAFMQEMELELYKLGVPVKTRHNEVAPSQFETAPIFEEVNVAVDHNQLTMETIRKVARRHGFEALLHEKPFAGVNGSGKHSNWSMSISSTDPELNGSNLLEPGKTPSQNLRFLVFLASVMKGVHAHAGLLRAGIASSGNDHRLGANEAPPAIISVFLGDLLNKICDTIEKGATMEDPKEAVLKLGVSKIPEVMKDNTDRNRTSPFAFTGNKFEFRAVGASASPALPVTFLNAAVADGIEFVTESIRAKQKAGKQLEAAALEVVREVIVATKSVRFEGNGYSEDWVKEAQRRGLQNLRKTPEALEQMTAPSSKAMLARLDVFSEAEITSREHVQVERYIKNLWIEVDTLRQMVETVVLPAGFTYLGTLASSVAASKAAGIPAPQADTAAKVAAVVQAVQQKRSKLDSLMQKVETATSDHDRAKLLGSDVSTAMSDLRASCDELEGMVADECWPLPKYREILFMS